MTVNTVTERKWYHFNIWAVLIGAAIDVISSNITAGCYAAIVTFVSIKALINQGLTIEEATSQLTTQLLTSPMTYALGFICSVASGYIAGRIARYHEIKHALATYVIILLFSLLLRLFVKGPQIDRALWLQFLLFLLQIASDTLGGYLAQLQRENIQKKVQTATP